MTCDLYSHDLKDFGMVYNSCAEYAHMHKLSIDFRVELGMYDPDAQLVTSDDVAFNTVVDANTEFKLSPEHRSKGTDSLSGFMLQELAPHSAFKQSNIPEPSPVLLKQIEDALAAVSVPFNGGGGGGGRARVVGPAVHGGGGGGGRARSAADSGFCDHGDGDSESGTSEASASGGGGGSRGSCGDDVTEAEVEAELSRVRARLLLPLPPAGGAGDAAAGRLQAAEARAQARWYRQQLEACQAEKVQLQQELVAAREQAWAETQRADRLQLEAVALAEREQSAQASASRLLRRLEALQADMQLLGTGSPALEVQTGNTAAPAPAVTATCQCGANAGVEQGPAGPDPERDWLLVRLAAAERGRAELEACARALEARMQLGDSELRARDAALAEARAQLAAVRGQLQARQQQQAQLDEAAMRLRADFARVSAGYRALKAELASRSADSNSNPDSEASPEMEDADLQRRRHERNMRVLLRELRRQVRARRVAEHRPVEAELTAAQAEATQLRSALAAAEAEGCALAERLRVLGGRWGFQLLPAPPPDLTRDLPAPPGRCEDPALAALLQTPPPPPPLGHLRTGLRALRQEVRALRLQLGPEAELVVPDVPA